MGTNISFDLDNLNLNKDQIKYINLELAEMLNDDECINIPLINELLYQKVHCNPEMNWNEFNIVNHIRFILKTLVGVDIDYDENNQYVIFVDSVEYIFNQY